MRPVKCLFTVFESVVASASSRVVIGSECQDLVKGYSGACFKKFTSYDEAIKFIEAGHKVGTVLSKKRRIESMNDDLDGREDPLPTKLSPEEHYISSNHVPSTLTFYHDASCPRRVMVYTDGSCNGAHDERRAGYGVYWGPNHPWNVSERLEGEQTNNRAEIEAVICAIKQAHIGGITHLGIVTDSKFTQNCATEWGQRWARNAWKLANGEDAKLKEPVKRLLGVIAESGIEIIWYHVRGHQGVHGNEEADSLANIGSSKPLPKK